MPKGTKDETETNIYKYTEKCFVGRKPLDIALCFWK